MEKNEDIRNILSVSATSLVATILGNLEILEKNNTLKHQLYKPLIKEAIYGQFKYITKLLTNPKVRFDGGEK